MLYSKPHRTFSVQILKDPRQDKVSRAIYSVLFSSLLPWSTHQISPPAIIPGRQGGPRDPRLSQAFEPPGTYLYPYLTHNRGLGFAFGEFRYSFPALSRSIALSGQNEMKGPFQHLGQRGCSLPHVSGQQPGLCPLLSDFSA